MKRNENLNRINIVLVEPEDCQNIGSVCRAIKTMGIMNLKIVGRDKFDIDRVKQLSVHAFDIFENKKLFKDLVTCLDSGSLSVAFTRRNGKYRKGSSISPGDLATFIKNYGNGEINLVFGRESNGLTDKEVQSCNMICTIETSDIFPSLNLSQAVQIAVYTIFTNLNDYPAIPYDVVTINKVNNIVEKACEMLSEMHYFKECSDEKDNFKIFLRDSLSKGSFSESDLMVISKFFKKIHDISLYKN